jgi:hypothetical protein
VDAHIEQNDQNAGISARQCFFHAADLSRPSSVAKGGMADGRIISKQSASIGQLAVFVRISKD